MIAVLSLRLHPAIAYGLSHWVFHLPQGFVRSAVMTAAMAPGVNSYVFASIYGRGQAQAASAVLLATGALGPHRLGLARGPRRRALSLSARSHRSADCSASQISAPPAAARNGAIARLTARPARHRVAARAVHQPARGQRGERDQARTPRSRSCPAPGRAPRRYAPRSASPWRR